MSYDFMSYNLGDAFRDTIKNTLPSRSFIEIKKQVEWFAKEVQKNRYEMIIISYSDYEDVNPLQSQEFYKQDPCYRVQLGSKIFIPVPFLLETSLIKNINPKYEDQIKVKYCFEVIATLENGNKDRLFGVVVFPEDKKMIYLLEK